MLLKEANSALKWFVLGGTIASGSVEVLTIPTSCSAAMHMTAGDAYLEKLFFKIFLLHICLFTGSYFLCVSKSELAALFKLRGDVSHIYNLRLTSCVTPFLEYMAASIVASYSPHMCCGIYGSPSIFFPCTPHMAAVSAVCFLFRPGNTQGCAKEGVGPRSRLSMHQGSSHAVTQIWQKIKGKENVQQWFHVFLIMCKTLQGYDLKP